jgi:hypothetical protein
MISWNFLEISKKVFPAVFKGFRGGSSENLIQAWSKTFAHKKGPEGPFPMRSE